MTLLMLVVLYPLVFIVSVSFFSPAAVASGKVVPWPVDIGVEGWAAVFQNANCHI